LFKDWYVHPVGRTANPATSFALQAHDVKSGGELHMSEDDLVGVRYMVDDVQAAVDFYTGHVGFSLRHSALPAFADIVRGKLRLLLAGPKSSTKRPMPDSRKPRPGGWNRIHLIVDDIQRESSSESSPPRQRRRDGEQGGAGVAE